MAVFCCCTSRTSKARVSSERDHQDVLPSPLPPVRLSGPSNLNPVATMSAGTSPRSLSSLQPSMPAAIAPLEPVELGELVIEDSDSEEEPDAYTHNKSTSTLQLVKTRIRRHLSQDSLSRRKTRSVVGSSQEELERRAELKRLMHKRIQEELRSEEGQASSQSEASSTHPQPVGLGIDCLPGGGPRDNIEFSVTEDSKPNTICHSRPGSGISISQPGQDHDRLLSRSATFTELPGPRHVRERSSLPEMPISPDLLPRRYPSTGGTSSLGSWRLSYSGGQLDEFLSYIDEGVPTRTNGTLRNSNTSPISSAPLSSPEALKPSSHTHSLSRSHSSPARHRAQESGSPSAVEQSPLSIWLRSQGLQSRSPSPTRSSDQDFEQVASMQQAEVVYLRRWSSVQNAAVPETDIQRPEVMHLYDMDIHRQLGTRGLNTPIDTRSRSISERCSGATVSGSRPQSDSPFQGPHSDSPDEIQNTLVLEAPLAIQDPNGLQTQSSSVYPSAAPSGYPSQGTSALHLPASHTLPAVFSLPGYNWLDNLYNPHAQSSSESTSRQTAGEGSLRRSLTPETGSRTRVNLPMPPLNSNGKILRDSAYGTVEKSIGSFHLGQGAPSLIAKRLSKEVEPPASERTKPSFLARLHLTLPRRSKLSPRTFDGIAPEIDPEPETRWPSPSQVSMGRDARPSSWGSGTNQTASYHPLTPILSEYEGSADDLWRAALQEKPQRSNFYKANFHRRGASFPENLLRKVQDTVAQSELSGGCSGCNGIPNTDRSHRMSSLPVPLVSYTTDYGLTSIEETRETPKDGQSYQAQPSVQDALRMHLPTRSASSFQISPASPVLQIPYTLCDTSIAAEASNPSVAELPEFPLPPCRQHMDVHSSNKPKDAHRRISKAGSILFPGRLGKAVKSGLSKLVPSRGTPNCNRSKSLGSHGKGIDYSKGESGRPEPRIVVPARVSSHGKPLVNQYPSGSHVYPSTFCQEALQEQNNITLCHVGGTSEPESRRFRSSTTTTTERFVTPMSSLYTGINNNNTGSFYSYSQSRSQSRVALESSDALTEIGTDVDSIQSENTRGQRNYSLNATSRRNVSEGKGSFTSWSGRSRTHPLLSLRNLDGMNRLAKEPSSRSLEVKVV